jgi:hypothetical protein
MKTQRKIISCDHVKCMLATLRDIDQFFFVAEELLSHSDCLLYTYLTLVTDDYGTLEE